MNLAKQYPYFQAVYALIAKIDPSSGNIKRASVCTSERTVLKNLVNSEFNPEVNMLSLDNLEIEDDFSFLEKIQETPSESGLEVAKEKKIENISLSVEKVTEKEIILKPEGENLKGNIKGDIENEEREKELSSPILDLTVDNDLEGIREEIFRSIEEIEQKRAFLEKIYQRKTQLEESKDLSSSKTGETIVDSQPSIKEKKEIKIKDTSPDKGEINFDAPIFFPDQLLFSNEEIPFELKVEDTKTYQKYVVQQFLKDKPSLLKEDFSSLKEEFKEDLSAQHVSILPVSENMAEIFYKQKKIVESIQVYKKLLLKYPEKKTFFAERINHLNRELDL